MDQCKLPNVNILINTIEFRSRIKKEIEKRFKKYPVCGCLTGCNDDCINRKMGIECSTDSHPTKCANHHVSEVSSFTQWWFLTLNGYQDTRLKIGLKRNSLKGLVVVAKEEIKMGQLIDKYNGVVRDKNQITISNNTYVVDLDWPSGFCIDATLCGSQSRFMSHSCTPNAYCQAVSRLSNTIQYLFTDIVYNRKRRNHLWYFCFKKHSERSWGYMGLRI